MFDSSCSIVLFEYRVVVFCSSSTGLKRCSLHSTPKCRKKMVEMKPQPHYSVRSCDCSICISSHALHKESCSHSTRMSTQRLHQFHSVVHHVANTVFLFFLRHLVPFVSLLSSPSFLAFLVFPLASFLSLFFLYSLASLLFPLAFIRNDSSLLVNGID